MSSPGPDFMDFDDSPLSPGAHDVDMLDEVEEAAIIVEEPAMDIDHAQEDELMAVIALTAVLIETPAEVNMILSNSDELAPVDESPMDTSISLECPRISRAVEHSNSRKRKVDNVFNSTERRVKARLMDDIYGDVEYTYPRENTVPAEPQRCPRSLPSHETGIHSCNQGRREYVAFIGTGAPHNCWACIYKDTEWCTGAVSRLCIGGNVRQQPFRVMHEGRRILDNADAPVPRIALLDEESNPLIAKPATSVPIFDISRIVTFATLVKLSTGDVNMNAPVRTIRFDPHFPQAYNLLAKFEEKDLYPDLLQPVDEKENTAKRQAKAARSAKGKKNNTVKEKVGLCVGKKSTSGKRKNGFFKIYNKVVEQVSNVVRNIGESPVPALLSSSMPPLDVFPVHVHEHSENTIAFSLPSPPITPPRRPFPNTVPKVIMDRRVTPEEIIAMAEERQRQADLRALTRTARRVARVAARQTTDITLVDTPEVDEIKLQQVAMNQNDHDDHDPVFPGAYPIEEGNLLPSWDPRFHGMPLWRYMYYSITGL